MKNYKTSGEHLFIIVPFLFLLINVLFRELLRPYLNLGPYWLLLFLIYPLAHYLQFKIDTIWTQEFYHVVEVISIFQLLFLAVGFMAHLIGILFDREIFMVHILSFSALVFLIGYLYSKFYFKRAFTIKSTKIKQKTRLIQISDVHAFGSLAKKTIKHIVKKILKFKPDIVVITGDLLDYYGLPKEDCLKPFKKIHVPIYFVYGNHERQLLNGYAEELINDSTLIPLVNDSINFNEFQIIGMDDMPENIMVHKFKNQNIKENNFTILLQHKPLNVDEISKKGVDLMLSGHTHAGQFFPVNLLFKFAFKYLVGKHKINNMTLYVSRGTGTKSFPFRFFIPNELTVIDLEPEE